ncbi:hypothetical protein [Vibrio fortis]|uniref:hypothetical protein n=1 Tax=Vibrio fortis TaxID=212667 RepID=UPI0038CD7EE9
MKLYKYLPSKFVDNVTLRGELLFRNLSYFRQFEDDRRGDPLEGFHRDNPDNDITLSCPYTGRLLAKGDYSFLNSTNSDLIFVFCLSKEYSARLYDEFEADACIEITDTQEFMKRSRFAVKRLISSHKSGLLNSDVIYYRDNAPAGFNIKDPKNLAFAKGVHYTHQNEHRMVFGTRKAFDLTQSIIINKSYDFIDDAKKGNAKSKLLRIGNISDIVKVHYV